MIGSPHTRTISFGDGVCAAQKMALQLLFRALAISLQGLFFNPECSHGLGAKIRSGAKNLSKSYFIWGSRRKKFPNSNPDSGSVPKPLNSRNFPPAISRSQTSIENLRKIFPRVFCRPALVNFFLPICNRGRKPQTCRPAYMANPAVSQSFGISGLPPCWDFPATASTPSHVLRR